MSLCPGLSAAQRPLQWQQYCCQLAGLHQCLQGEKVGLSMKACTLSVGVPIACSAAETHQVLIRRQMLHALDALTHKPSSAHSTNAVQASTHLRQKP